MTPEETAEMNRLCGLIAVEKDHVKFVQYVRQLNDLLERKEHRLVERDKEKS